MLGLRSDVAHYGLAPVRDVIVAQTDRNVAQRLGCACLGPRRHYLGRPAHADGMMSVAGLASRDSCQASLRLYDRWGRASVSKFGSQTEDLQRDVLGSGDCPGRGSRWP